MITIGQITTFLVYMLMLMVNFGMLAGTFTSVMGIIGSADKIVHLIEAKTKVNAEGGIRPDKEMVPKGDIELVDVNFSYPSKPNVEVLKGVNIKVDSTKNRVIAICG
jgi:ABC-type multidrug transport system fused ATPase/permease subunit